MPPALMLQIINLNFKERNHILQDLKWKQVQITAYYEMDVIIWMLSRVHHPLVHIYHLNIFYM